MLPLVSATLSLIFPSCVFLGSAILWSQSARDSATPPHCLYLILQCHTWVSPFDCRCRQQCRALSATERRRVSQHFIVRNVHSCVADVLTLMLRISVYTEWDKYFTVLVLRTMTERKRSWQWNTNSLLPNVQYYNQYLLCIVSAFVPLVLTCHAHHKVVFPVWRKGFTNGRKSIIMAFVVVVVGQWDSVGNMIITFTHVHHHSNSILS